MMHPTDKDMHSRDYYRKARLSPTVPAFSFQRQRERIDWKKIAAVDVDEIVRNVDVALLQDNLSSITFCDIQSEIGPYLDPNFAKVFRLAQLSIEYLLHSQECLSSAFNRTEHLYSNLKQKMLSKNKQKHVKHLRESKGSVETTSSNQHQCVHCQKRFLSDTYLHMHLLRRHPDVAFNGASINDTKYDLGKELQTIKEWISSQQAFRESQVTTKYLHNETSSKGDQKTLVEELAAVREKCVTIEKQLLLLEQTRN